MGVYPTCGGQLGLSLLLPALWTLKGWGAALRGTCSEGDGGGRVQRDGSCFRRAEFRGLSQQGSCGQPKSFTYQPGLLRRHGGSAVTLENCHPVPGPGFWGLCSRAGWGCPPQPRPRGAACWLPGLKPPVPPSQRGVLGGRSDAGTLLQCILLQELQISAGPRDKQRDASQSP